jgi:DNA-binding MarR family transcriptional regulator
VYGAADVTIASLFVRLVAIMNAPSLSRKTAETGFMKRLLIVKTLHVSHRLCTFPFDRRSETWYIYVVGYIVLEDEMGESKIDHTYGLLIARMAHIHRIRIEEYLSQHNLHVGQEMLLKYLWNQDGLSQKEIGEFMGIQSATVTRMVIRMERSGFVERRTEPDDQRVSRVYLTDSGRSLQRAVEQGWMALEQQILADFSLEERLLLRRYLEQIYRNLS